MEATSTITEKDTQIRRLMVSDDEVEVAVVVHVGDGDVVGLMTGGKGRLRRRVKASMAIAEEYGDRTGIGTIRARIGDDDVWTVIMVDVGDGNPPRIDPAGNSHLMK